MDNNGNVLLYATSGVLWVVLVVPYGELSVYILCSGSRKELAVEVFISCKIILF